MGWKAIRDHYRIEHIVQVTSAGICIGSPYIHDIIVISIDRGEIIRRWGTPHRGSLGRYLEEMDADPGKLAELAAVEDHFERSITVYTYEGASILEKQCEELGWPNVTHDGLIQFENTFSADRAEVVEWAISNAKAGVENASQMVRDLQTDLERARERLAQKMADHLHLTTQGEVSHG